MSDKIVNYPGTPGRGLMNAIGYEQRMSFLNKLDLDSTSLVNSQITQEQVKNNIESFIGTVEIPVGLAGPLLYKDENEVAEFVYTAVATTEGALLASINRGAKAISECGGFSARVIHQKMLRTPMFAFENLHQAFVFEKWIALNFNTIKNITTQYSNHANLIEIKPYLIGKIVHLKFTYHTGDASGQNMTTNCTWHACLWIEAQFNAQHPFPIAYFVIDGNGASDKKVSYFSLQNGRGTHVVSECFLTNEVIVKTLRTTASDMFRAFNHSMAIGKMDGMIGYNINVANAIAGIFTATGQDIGCVHESSTAILQMEPSAEGLYLSLSLPNLVIGTIGGGTHLPAQKSVLNLMKCYGTGKVKRFACLISGFALSLEISTLAAIVSGQFARAHQKLGRNKQVNWLLGHEVDAAFIKKHLVLEDGKSIESVHFDEKLSFENGILTDLTSRITRKLIGFIPLEIKLNDGAAAKILIKSKPLDLEVIKGLHYMAANIDAKLADTILVYKEELEYKNSHLKEIEAYAYIHERKLDLIPQYFGAFVDPLREVYLFMQELLDHDKMLLINSEDTPELWTDVIILNTISQITKLHVTFLNGKVSFLHIKPFDVLQSLPLYAYMNAVNKAEYSTWECDALFDELNEHIEKWQTSPPAKKTPFTFIHNDFNPRNIAVLKTKKIKAFDWELATLNIPQRDVVELLSFVLPEDFEKERFLMFIDTHLELFNTSASQEISKQDWYEDYIHAGYEYLMSRVSFYLAGNTLVKYTFSERIFKNTFKMISILNG
jgi:hydroxymethylglutaryl-CoA reductase (NADPH)